VRVCAHFAQTIGNRSDAPRRHLSDIAGMTRMPRSITLFAGAMAPLIAVAAAGCGSSSKGGSATVGTPTTATGHAAVIGAADAGSLGTILVDSQGRTLYLFKKDSGTHSACTGACAAAWPPLRASGKPTVGGGASAAKVGTTPRSDGMPQVTYGGHPLYLFQGDKSPGDTNGQGVNAFGGGWFALSATGSQVSGTASTSGGGSSGGSFGY
jgi:predicted lipoprotein with Yx(FWY)xxD motif